MRSGILAARAVTVVLVLALAGAGASLGVGVNTGAVAASVTSGHLQVDGPPAANNTSVHVHPDRASGSRDLVGARAWLAGRLAVELEDCVTEVGLGTTDVCEFEDEYPDWVRMYVDIAGETADEADDRRGDVFDRTREDHREYSRAVASFRETYREYQQARESGDDERARALARDLRRQADAANEAGVEILASYEVIESEVTVDMTDPKRRVNETLANVSETVEAIEGVEFVETELTAAITPRTISFLEPGTVTGRLETANGTPVAEAGIRLLIGERTVVTRTDQSGRFVADYRPTTLPVETEHLGVRYVPPDESRYLGSNTTVGVSVRPVEPLVDVLVEPTSARFGDELVVRGAVTAMDIAAPGVPVVVTVDGRTVAEVTTDENGRFAISTRVQAPDGPGEVTVLAAYPLENRALAAGVGTTTTAIQETVTTLTIEASAADARTATVEGQVVTEDGLPVAQQPVTIRANGTAVQTVRTGNDGRFAASVSVPERLIAEETASTVELAAAFDGTGTNLRASAASTVVRLPAPVGGAADTLLGDIPPEGGWELLAVIGLALLAIGYLARRRGVLDGRHGPGADDGPIEPTEAEKRSGPPDELERPGTTLDPARATLGDDTDAAVMLAYAAVREALARGGDPAGRRAVTHWEFLDACRGDGLDGTAIDSLTRLTEAYERAAYAPTPISKTDADEALTTAETLV